LVLLRDRRSAPAGHAPAHAGHGDDGLDGTALLLVLVLYLGSPEVLDLVVRPAREVLGDPRPPAVEMTVNQLLTVFMEY
jgi:hypothetical protein